MPAAPRFVPWEDYREYPADEMRSRADWFYLDVKRRRSVRHFSARAVDRGIIESCLQAAGTAPSGANLQPWHFVVVSSPQVKTKIRIAAEQEEREFYETRATPEWLAALEPLGTDADKPFLEIAPHLIVVFRKTHDVAEGGGKVKHYYSSESVGLATGFLLAALHHSGLATLTHTPSPMNFLNQILDRPSNEKPFLIVVTGYPADDALVPAIEKKELGQIATFV